MRDIDKDMVLRLVEENAKKRFELVYGYDPSPPVPKKAKGQNRVKGKNQGGPKAGKKTGTPESTISADTGIGTHGHPAELGLAETVEQPLAESITADLASVSITSTELPLVVLPNPTDVDDTAPDGRTGYYIRASQGHSIQLEGVAHLEPVDDDEDGRMRAGLAVHGTRWELWDVLSMPGLVSDPPITSRIG
jgi:2'-phosphotransferase